MVDFAERGVGTPADTAPPIRILRAERVLPVITLLLLLGLWEFLDRGLGIRSFIIPSPEAIARAIVDISLDGSLAANLLVTAEEALIGFVFAVVAGIALGAVIARSPLLERAIYGYLVAIQTMPKIALAPVFVTWFGFGLASKVAVAALIAFFPMLVNVIIGLKSCDEGKIDVMRALSASEWQIFRLVRLPSALPFIFAGLEIAVIFSLTGAIVGEFVGAREGLGYLMLLLNSRMEIASVFAVLIVLAVIGSIMHGAVVALRRRLLYWEPDDSVVAGRPIKGGDRN